MPVTFNNGLQINIVIIVKMKQETRYGATLTPNVLLGITKEKYKSLR